MRPAPPPEVDVAVVGAGAAGLAAGAVLRAAGRSVALLEAGTRAGGRAHTVRAAPSGDIRTEAWMDAGAIWLHETARNPLARLAESHGVACRPGHQGDHRLFVDDRPADAAAMAAYDVEYAAWERACLAAADGPDCALAEAGPDGPWRGNIENWEASIIAAADARHLGLADWRRNRLDESDLTPPHGLGTLLLQLLGPLAGPVRHRHAVAELAWSGEAIVLSGGFGRLAARAAIVTVSTGVLRAGAIRFSPALPPATLEAIGGLPMGLLSRLALPARGGGRLGLPAGALLEPRMARGRPRPMFQAWSDGAPFIVGFFGGDLAWSLAGRPEAARAMALDELRRLLGPPVDAGLAPEGGFVSSWGEDPLFRGAYAYCPPGCAGARAALAEPLADGRLLFAGEACREDGLAGTVGGALSDGERAARIVLRRRFGADDTPDLIEADRQQRRAAAFPRPRAPV